MRANRWLIPTLFSAIGCALGCALAAAGCGDDTNAAADASGGDSTADSTEDTTGDTTQSEAQSDVVQSDVPQNDVFQADVFQADVVDAGAGDGDAASNPDVATDAQDSSAALNFPAQLAAARCSAVADCCGTSGDAATFNWSLCLANSQSGFFGSNSYADLFPYGNMVFDAAAAQACLNDYANIDCTTNQISSALETRLFQDCFGVYTGTQSAGAPCRATAECNATGFCLPVDGGLPDAGAGPAFIGICQPLAGDGGSCNALGGTDTVLAQTVCSYRGAGNTGLFCDTFSTPGNTMDASAWVCAPQGPLGAPCEHINECQSFICPSTTCGTAVQAYSPSTCASYSLDAGTD